MKKITLFLILSAGCSTLALTQNVNVATRQRGATVQHFTGTTALRQAYAASSNSDTIYLSGGTFTAPDSINKRLVIIGTGHYPDSTLATTKTIVTNHMNLYENADNCYFEGIHFLNNFIFVNNTAADNVTLRRCRFDGEFRYNGGGTNTCKNNLITECVFAGPGFMLYFINAVSLTISKCLFFNDWRSFDAFRQVTFVNNIVFCTNGTYLLQDAQNSIIKNNIFSTTSGAACNGSNCYFANNVVFSPHSTIFFTNMVTSTFVNNFTNVIRDNFFENQTGTSFSYAHDYRLKSTVTNKGDDGTQVGIYGTSAPYKAGAVPGNPHIISRNIAASTNLNGNLQIQVKVAAQQQ